MRVHLLNSAVEMLPNRSNRIVPSTTERDRYGIPRPEIRFEIDDYAREALRASKQLHKQVLMAMGAKEENVDYWLDLKPDPALPDFGSGHVIGTTVMGDKPESSVVDAWGRVHDCPNLFILGSSVFPTAAAANPTLTIAALVLRSINTIKTDLRKG